MHSASPSPMALPPPMASKQLPGCSMRRLPKPTQIQNKNKYCLARNFQEEKKAKSDSLNTVINILANRLSLPTEQPVGEAASQRI